ncbi:heterokaryon incompatibility protein-domain-containing protein [Xylariaceae sp. FL1651]|nr:heterokaryon incompatibility protein-domain-containing protein [Xylariaceae sp. FL1651]
MSSNNSASNLPTSIEQTVAETPDEPRKPQVKDGDSHTKIEDSQNAVTIILDPHMAYTDLATRLLGAAEAMHNVDRPYLFKHRPLQESREIRVIDLLPGSGEDKICCSMQHTQLGSFECPFEALSYTWGDPKSIAMICIDDAPFPVRDNLRAALWHLRRPDRPRTLWIDALCINQQDNEEKSFQVQLMSSIYAAATTVIVWLGTSADDSDIAMDFLSGDISASDEKSETISSVAGNGIDALGSDIRQLSIGSKEGASRAHHDATKEDRIWEAVRNLASRPYWSRAWVLQEVAVAKTDPILVCGHRTAAWKSLSTERFSTQGVRFTFLSPENVARIRTGYRTAAIFMVRDEYRKRSGGIDLDRLLMLTLTFEATDPVDKIFALVGLSTDSTKRAVLPDYSKSPAQVYTEAARYLINMSGNMNSLCCNTNSPRMTGLAMPSWVPDWTLRATRPKSIFNPGLYWAADRSKASVRFVNDARNLQAVGVLVDEIDAMTGVLELNDLKTDLQAIQELILYNIESRVESGWVKSSINNFKCTLRLDPDPRNSDQFWRTMLLDRIFDRDNSKYRSPAPAWMASRFDYFMYPSHDPDRRLHSALQWDSFQLDWPKLSDDSPQATIPETFRPDLRHDPAERSKAYTEPLTELIGMQMQGRQFFVTRQGRMGMFSPGADLLERGDKVVVLLGSDMPFILRDHSHSKGKDPDTVPESCQRGLHFMGEAYVYGLMRGEAVKPLKNLPKREVEKHLMWFEIH